MSVNLLIAVLERLTVSYTSGGLRKSGTLNFHATRVGFLYNKAPKKVPLISETPSNWVGIVFP